MPCPIKRSGNTLHPFSSHYHRLTPGLDLASKLSSVLSYWTCYMLQLSRDLILKTLSPSRVTEPKGNVSSIICLSQAISEVRDVPLSVFIDKSPVLTTKVFYYKDNPMITAVLPDCSFDRSATFSHFSLSSLTHCKFRCNRKQFHFL